MDSRILKAAQRGSFASKDVVPVFISPADPTVRPLQAICSYPANAQFFRERPPLQNLTDGSSNTIFFAEHYG
ncbi:MAG: hypothetical protein SNJ75_04090 [Gemmataceae bacterium]